MSYRDYQETPIGMLEVTANDDGILSIYFVEQRKTPAQNAMTDLAKAQLSEYFAKTRHAFDLPLCATGTEFQSAVWAALRGIDYGETCSYLDIASMLDNPKAVRAVGAANGKNPISIVVPCHRVIAANGALSGYAGGTHRKAWLLAHESDDLFNQRFTCL